MQHADLSCEDFRLRLSARIDGEDREPAALAAHLAGCAGCREHELELIALSRSFARLREAGTPAVDLWPSIERRTRSRPAAQLLARAAAALIGFAAVGAVARLSDRGTSAASEVHVLERFAASRGAPSLFAAVPEYNLLRSLSAEESSR
jgi:predicted anti-sigma-YlaC factor YlaD